MNAAATMETASSLQPTLIKFGRLFGSLKQPGKFKSDLDELEGLSEFDSDENAEMCIPTTPSNCKFL